ncbi:MULTISPECIES: FUSC family protein [Streptomyces]|uniref:FUSC family protein n=2 Tax=Streptomyces TaxID=1883 RepID=A0ABU3JCE9_9ACTN|nr:FUSC family protein [Streptomyces sp. McG7]MBT2903861.1 FUSC family protein [Streptomyces sp. McG8]MDQ0490175.1 putative membrane protein YccC [Streptomyces thermodiastaticus]MDT6972733.1 FUSC family protein [Streptomyces thermocarboxydus]MXQ60924.1 FUSC family protein [Streptomyces sp. XHT-2]THC59091.1 FUSC family protein [Streptomyces sp. Akac8]WSB39796.1 FUSC family protein [Streptomyces cellulosae]
MKAAVRRSGTRLRDHLAASDPGLLRLTAGLRTVGAIALTLAVLAPTGADLTHLVAGAMTSMVATFAIRERKREAQAVTLAMGLPVALVSVSLGALLSERVVVGDVFSVVLIFCAVYGRRFGDRGLTLGLIGFQMYFVSLFVGATPGRLPALWAVITVGFACSALVRFAVVPVTPAGLLARLRQAFRVRLARLVSAQIALLDAGPDEADKALEEVRERTARLHETALMIQSRLEEGTPDEPTARLVQRRIADAEIAAERLGLLLLSARSAQRADTLTLHLPGAPAPEVGRLPGPEEATAQLRRDLRALRALILRTGTAGAGVAQVRNRLLGYRDEENLPAASAPVRDVFRGIGEAARAVMGLRIALDGPQDESDDSPATARSREELDAEDAAIDAEEAEEAEEPKGLRRPTTRAAVQVSVGSTLAIVGGELLSTDRWYWAVLTCWIVFINTASTGEILVKGYRRLLGTVFGVAAGILLAGLVGGNTVLAFALVLVLIFAMFYTAPLSYTLMSFFVTAMLGLLYTLLHTYSWEVLVLRVEETALGAVCGVVAAALVLPVRTDWRTNELLVTVLERLSDVTEAAVTQLSGGPADELLDKARELDQALGDLRSATKPLTHPVTPLRARRTTARYVVALLETCAYHARSLAATAELLPTHPSIAADPRLRGAAGRTVRNIRTIAARVADDEVTDPVETGPSIASLLADDDASRYGRITGRVLRHLERLDEAVVGLARPLDVPVKTPEP